LIYVLLYSGFKTTHFKENHNFSRPKKDDTQDKPEEIQKDPLREERIASPSRDETFGLRLI